MGQPAEDPPCPEHHRRMAKPIARSHQSGCTNGDSAFGVGLVVNVITNVVISIAINITTLSIITINPDPCPAA